MANPEHLKILKQGVTAWNKWRKENPGVIPDLTGANLAEAHLVFADLRGANLSRAELDRSDFRGADLRGANLREADLHSAILRLANLVGATLKTSDFRGAYLIGADVSEAYLGEANLRRANLDNSDFTDARVISTVFGDNDLSTVKGLETVRHDGPSTVGVDTIYKSKGNIPEAFLRGAGVPEDFITYMKSLVGKAIEFYSCFISYSSKDDDFAQRFYADLQAKNVRCWKFVENAKWGEPV